MEEKRGAVGGSGVEAGGPGGPVLAWTPSQGLAPGENTSETESIESRESAKSRDTSPSHSPPVSVKAFSSIYPPEVSSEHPTIPDRGLFILINLGR